MKRAHTSFGLLLLACLSWLTCMPLHAAKPSPTDEAEILKDIHARTEAWNKHDMVAWSAAMADDAQWINVVGDRWIGKTAITATLTRYHQTIFKDRRLGVEEHLVMRQQTPDVIITTMIDPADAYTNSAGAHVPPTRNVLTLTWVKRSGRWWIVQGHNTIEIAEAQKNNPVHHVEAQ